MTEWQPISTAKAEHMLFFGRTLFGQDKVVFTGFKGINGKCYSDSGTKCFPTHWMPKPEPPKDT